MVAGMNEWLGTGHLLRVGVQNGHNRIRFGTLVRGRLGDPIVFEGGRRQITTSQGNRGKFYKFRCMPQLICI